MLSSDLSFFQSQSQGSTGGAISMISIPGNALALIWPDVLLAELQSGAVHYLKVFAVNTGTDTLTAARAFMVQTIDGESLEMAVGDSGDTDPSALTFLDYPQYASGLALGDMAPGAVVAIWIRRVTPADMSAFDGPAFFQLFLSGIWNAARLTASLTFSWGLEQAQEPDMTTNLAYEFKLQGTDDNNQISTQAKVDVSITLSGGVQGDQIYEVPAGAVNFPLQVINSSGVDFIMIVPTKLASIKLNDVGNTPIPAIQPNGLFVLDGAGITAIFATNPDATGAMGLRLIQAKRNA